MTDEEPSAPPPIRPGDLVQVADQAHVAYRAVLVVSEVHRWGVGATMQALDGRRLVEAYHRLRRAQVVVVGVAALVPPEVAEARRDALKAEAADVL